MGVKLALISTHAVTDGLFKENKMESIAIFTYNFGLLGLEKAWRFQRKVTWAEYEVMAKNYPGEGSTWKAEVI